MPIKTSRFSNPQWLTRSALDRYFSARATSTNPKTIFTVFIQLPDRGKVCSQPGKRAKSANGRPSATPNPAMATVSCTAPPSLSSAPTNKVPSIGPVQEKETIANVSAMKKMPPSEPRLDLAAIEFEIPLGSVISKSPKKESAKTRKMAAKVIFSQTLVDML